MILSEGIPESLLDAYRLLSQGSAWVVCLARPDGTVATVASPVTTAQLQWDQVSSQYMTPDCPKTDRAAFLLGGIKQLEEQVFA